MSETILSAEDSQKSARYFYYGNLVAALLPLPFFIFWFGASIIAYSMFRYHPNPRVGYYTQIAAYQYYSTAGLLVPVIALYPPESLTGWLVLVGIVSTLLIIGVVHGLRKIAAEQWEDVVTDDED